MKKIIFIFLTISIFSFGCKNNSTNDSNDTDISSDTIVSHDVSTSDQISEPLVLEYLPDVLKRYDSDLYEELVVYLDLLNSIIDDETQILSVLSMRDSMMNDMCYAIENYYYEEGETDWDTWSLVEQELDTIGFWTIYAEGMFMDLGVAPILEDEINNFASEEFKIFTAFNNEYSKSRGGEYPFMSVIDYYPVIIEGEKLYKDYSSSKYFNQIKEKYFSCLSIVMDMHKVNFGDASSDYFYGEFHYGFYPFATSFDDLDLIIQEYPNSMFISVIEKLTKNMSEISVNLNDDDVKSEIYAIVIDKLDGYDEVYQKLFDYLNQGYDIVHSITSTSNDDKVDYYTCYRFYSDKKIAEENLQNIIGDFPNARIIHLILTEEFEPATLID